MNLPNRLTLLRIWMTLLIIFILSLNFAYSYTLANFLFIAAAITDYYDGKIARERKIITTFGRIWDPLADKLLVGSVFVFFASLDGIPIKPWMSIVIISREFLVTGLRLIAAKDNVVISADSLGKMKTAFQIMTIVSTLTYLSCLEVATDVTVMGKGFTRFAMIFSYILTWLAVFMTLLSGILIIWRNRKYLFSQT